MQTPWIDSVVSICEVHSSQQTKKNGATCLDVEFKYLGHKGRVLINVENSLLDNVEFYQRGGYSELVKRVINNDSLVDVVQIVDQQDSVDPDDSNRTRIVTTARVFDRPVIVTTNITTSLLQDPDFNSSWIRLDEPRRQILKDLVERYNANEGDD